MEIQLIVVVLEWKKCAKSQLKMKLARMEQDISQTDLAKRIGVTRQTIGMIESGDYNPTLKLCLAICKELGKTLDELFWEED